MTPRSRAPLAIRPHIAVDMPQSAMVLAAGLGKRMRPLTATRPKPLVEVAGRTLLDRALDRVEKAGIATAIVNAHYFADQIDAAVAARRQENPGPLAIRVSDERGQLLETGGGITKALPLIDADPFFVINADNMWIDGSTDTLRLLAQRWNPDMMDALLLLVPLARASGYEGRGDFHLDPNGVVTPRGEFRIAPFVYSGIQLISKQLFDGEPVEPFSMWRAWNKAFATGRIYGAVHQGLWFHVGTPASVGETETLLATA
ncbi:nucleotidyltransferase family protein [Polymorphobacter fuscus]|uniref:NTP transferase domain-containing protein n=1 Tax=Sandarakinorhabdus fusca TaxID=1439888 RepID=A0A7C9GUC1_9SPHN|nr:nucleotidyltransferase family protein [Polymorphobacter fuscus]KAB7647420.1 nucleotidyltransferase family protein [Polymorphobacter fuscus]MQT16669.1 NTP transferase domain-containing protein [Polymorphobacter fuscus]NJC09346.1 MurNAc alpha-1-phosphate uridylyltransferase [Polymorphobacter fuscus]